MKISGYLTSSSCGRMHRCPYTSVDPKKQKASMQRPEQVEEADRTIPSVLDRGCYS